MSVKKKFRAVIQKADGGGAYVTVPFEVEKVFGKKRVKVKAAIEGEPYRGSLVRMGGPEHVLGILKDIRDKIGKTYGDEIEVVVEEDTGVREVAPPEDFKLALDKNPEAGAFYEKLSYSHQRQYVLWIEEAKQRATRQNRIAKAIEMLIQGKKA